MVRIRLTCAVVAGSLLLATQAANAALNLSIRQAGADVVATLNGTLDLTGLTDIGSFGSPGPSVYGSLGFITFFPDMTSGKGFSGFSGPAAWGSGTTLFSGLPAPGSDPFGFNASAFFVGPVVFVDSGFVSGGMLSASQVFNGTTLAGLGLTSGTYVYSSSADSITVSIGVPEPMSWALMVTGFGMLGAAMRRRRRTLETGAFP